MLEPLRPAKEIVLQYASKEEKTCSDLMQHYLNWKPELGKTYQFPLSKRHDGDFFLPAQNLVLEYHPIVIRYYGGPSVFKRMKALQERLSSREFVEVEDVLCTQIAHDYTKRRRTIMDLSDNEDVRKMRLIVVQTFEELFQQIIRPYSKEKVSHSQFKNYIEKLEGKNDRAKKGHDSAAP